MTTWGELKVQLQDMPDNAHIMMDEDGTFRFAEVRLDKILPAVNDYPPCVLLELGQVWNEELDLDNRFNDYIGFEPEK
jgi:hypothetical protein